MTELQMIRATIPKKYKEAQHALIEYKRSQNKYQKELKDKSLSELFRLISEELNLSCKYNSRSRNTIMSPHVLCFDMEPSSCNLPQ